MDIEAGQVEATNDQEFTGTIGKFGTGQECVYSTRPDVSSENHVLPPSTENEKRSHHSLSRSSTVQSWEEYPIPARELENDYLADSERKEWVELKDKLGGHDQRKIKNCNDDIDTLLVFAGLFSAILTAFSVISYQNLTLQPDDAAVTLLSQLSQQIYDLSANNINNRSSMPLPPPPTFVGPSLPSVWINTLWFSSLVCSLVSASLGMLVKQWLREYLAGVYISPQQQLRSRHYLYGGLLKGRVFEVAAFLPVLLQIALVLFFAGLSIFLQGLNLVVGYVVTALIATWMLTYVMTIIAPIVWSQCPYKTPLLNSTVQAVRLLLARAVGTGRRLWKKPSSLPTNDYRFPGDPRGVRRDTTLDAHAVISADATFLDDTFLNSVIRPCVEDLRGQDVVVCMRQFYAHRMDYPVSSLEQPLDFKRITTRCLSTLVQMLVSTVSRELNKPDVVWRPWMHEALVGIWAALQHASYESRYIGPVEEQARSLPHALAKSPEVVEGLLVSLLPFQDTTFHVPSLTREVMSLITEGSRKVLYRTQENQVDPLKLCRVILYISLLQHDVHQSQDELVALFSDMASMIEEWTRTHVVSNADVQICLDRSFLLSATFPRSIGTALNSLLSMLITKDRLSRQDTVRDLKMMLRSDSPITDHALLGTILRRSLAHVSGQEVVHSMRKVVALRVRHHVQDLSSNVDLYKIGAGALEAAVHILVDALDKEIENPGMVWCPWMTEALMFVCAIHHHSRFGGRPIGPAKPRCEVVLSKLLTCRIDIVREAVIAMSMHPGIAGSVAPSSKAMLNIIEVARQLVRDKHVGPLGLWCTLALHLGSMASDSLREVRPALSGMLQELVPEIERLRIEGGLKPVAGRWPAHVAEMTFLRCETLNKRHMGFVEQRTMDLIASIQRGEYTH